MTNDELKNITLRILALEIEILKLQIQEKFYIMNEINKIDILNKTIYPV